MTFFEIVMDGAVKIRSKVQKISCMCSYNMPSTCIKNVCSFERIFTAGSKFVRNQKFFKCQSIWDNPVRRKLTDYQVSDKRKFILHYLKELKYVRHGLDYWMKLWIETYSMQLSQKLQNLQEKMQIYKTKFNLLYKALLFYLIKILFIKRKNMFLFNKNKKNNYFSNKSCS